MAMRFIVPHTFPELLRKGRKIRLILAASDESSEHDANSTLWIIPADATNRRKMLGGASSIGKVPESVASRGERLAS
jgi:hypothetical protein